MTSATYRGLVERVRSGGSLTAAQGELTAGCRGLSLEAVRVLAVEAGYPSLAGGSRAAVVRGLSGVLARHAVSSYQCSLIGGR